MIQTSLAWVLHYQNEETADWWNAIIGKYPRGQQCSYANKYVLFSPHNRVVRTTSYQLQQTDTQREKLAGLIMQLLLNRATHLYPDNKEKSGEKLLFKQL